MNAIVYLKRPQLRSLLLIGSAASLISKEACWINKQAILISAGNTGNVVFYCKNAKNVTEIEMK